MLGISILNTLHQSMAIRYLGSKIQIPHIVLKKKPPKLRLPSKKPSKGASSSKAISSSKGTFAFDKTWFASEVVHERYNRFIKDKNLVEEKGFSYANYELCTYIHTYFILKSCHFYLISILISIYCIFLENK